MCFQLQNFNCAKIFSRSKFRLKFPFIRGWIRLAPVIVALFTRFTRRSHDVPHCTRSDRLYDNAAHAPATPATDARFRVGLADFGDRQFGAIDRLAIPNLAHLLAIAQILGEWLPGFSDRSHPPA
jgi:hypothetical protein